MAITLALGGTTVTLSERLLWTDEFDWSPVQQSIGYSITGAMLVSVADAVKQAGRPITLTGTDSAAWTTRDVCDTLRAWANVPGAQLQLVLRGAARTVIFDQEPPGGFEARPVHQLLDGEIDGQTLYLPTLRLLTA
jgi:hypothetical protein